MSKIRSWFRDAVIRGTPQTMFLSVAMTLILVNYGLFQRKTYVKEQIESVETRLSSLVKAKELNFDEFMRIRKQLMPVKYPLRGSASWLEYLGIATPCLMFGYLFLTNKQSRFKERAAGKDRSGEVC